MILSAMANDGSEMATAQMPASLGSQFRISNSHEAALPQAFKIYVKHF